MKVLKQVPSNICTIMSLPLSEQLGNLEGANEGDFPGSSVDNLYNWKLSVLIHLPTTTLAVERCQ